jgi:hypothetical protein
MRVGTTLVLACLLFGRVAHADSTSVWEGNVRVGGIIEDEVGDRTLMQETFNIHEGVTFTKLHLNGRFNRDTHLYFDADNITMDGRRAQLDFRRTGLGRFRSRYDESDYLFDPDGSVLATRRDWWSTLSYMPRKWLWISGDYGLQTRRGDRIGYPDSAASALGTAYDSNLNRWRVEVQGNHSRGVSARAWPMTACRSTTGSTRATRATARWSRRTCACPG